MELLLIFALFTFVVLGALCLLVLEYQNLRNKRWSPPINFSAPPPQSATVPQLPFESERRSVPHRVHAIPIRKFKPKNDTVLTGV